MKGTPTIGHDINTISSITFLSNVYIGNKGKCVSLVIAFRKRYSLIWQNKITNNKALCSINCPSFTISVYR